MGAHSFFLCDQQFFGKSVYLFLLISFFFLPYTYLLSRYNLILYRGGIVKHIFLQLNKPRENPRLLYQILYIRSYQPVSYTHLYFPVLANIGEQPIYSREIYYDNDGFGSLDNVFGYQEAWACLLYTSRCV